MKRPDKMEQSVVLIGAGNLATQLGIRLVEQGVRVAQVVSRTDSSARMLAGKLHAEWTVKPECARRDADIYIYAVADGALADVARAVCAPHALHLHTAGSMSLNVLGVNGNRRFGVLYPLQTFSKGRQADFGHITAFIEGNTAETEEQIETLARILTPHVMRATSEQRRQLHLAAVFACNFTNRMYAIADKLLRQAGLPFSTLLPLIDETAAKVHDMPPREAQTGPAVRYDRNVMDRHLEMMGNEQFRQIYSLMSRNIHEEYSE